MKSRFIFLKLEIKNRCPQLRNQRVRSLQVQHRLGICVSLLGWFPKRFSCRLVCVLWILIALPSERRGCPMELGACFVEWDSKFRDRRCRLCVSTIAIEGMHEKWSAFQAHEHWSGSEFSPMASNLQMVFYTNKNGEILVKLLYNEKEVSIMKFFRSISRYFRDAYKSVFRNFALSLASISCITITLIE
mgnify:CR=1 FL=1